MFAFHPLINTCSLQIRMSLSPPTGGFSVPSSLRTASQQICMCGGVGVVTGNLLVSSRGPGQIHRRLVNEAGDVSEDMEMGRHFHVPALLFRKTEGNGTRHTCVSVPFLLCSLLFHSIGLQVGLLAKLVTRPCNLDAMASNH